MTAQKKVLGRGLGSLIPGKDVPQGGSGYLEIAVDQVDANPYQPRKRFDDVALTELTRSIQEHGVLQPLLVTRTSADRYRLIAGERRLRAARRAGLRVVPAVVREALPNQQSLEAALIENVQRADLDPIEEAHAYEQLHREFKLTQEEIAKRVGKERSTVANALRLLKLPESVQNLVASNELSMGHARALLAVGDNKKLEALARRVIADGLNVRQTEALVSPPAKTAGAAGGAAAPKDVFTREAEEKLTRRLRTRVQIERGRRGGKISVHFSSEDELIRLFDELSGQGRQR